MITEDLVLAKDNAKFKKFSYKERLWAEIDLDVMEHNFKVIRKSVANDAGICCTIKANGYGLGAVRLGALYESLGADMLAVACVDEALEIRNSGVKLPILILGYTPPCYAAELASRDFVQCVYSFEYAHMLSREAINAGVCVRVHIKIDSGMGRLGFTVRPDTDNSCLASIYECAILEGLNAEGIFTHFSVSDGGEECEQFTKQQFASFRHALNYLEERGIEFKYRHCANSAAIFDYPEYHLDMMRAGIALYGIHPSEQIRNCKDLKEALTLKSVISHIKTVKPGESISYGRTYIADSERRIASVPIGYADGLFRCLSGGKTAFTVHGKRAPIVGRICMDQTMIDLTDIPEAEPFDEIMIFGKDALMSAADVASASGTIPYEVLTSISRRVPRVYIEKEQIVNIENYLIKTSKHG